MVIVAKRGTNSLKIWVSVHWPNADCLSKDARVMYKSIQTPLLISENSSFKMCSLLVIQLV